MEEILASIRRIIADDDASKSAQRPAEPARPAPRPVAPPSPQRSFAPLPSAEMSAPELDVEEPPSAPAEAVQEDAAADILDLTESMTTPSFAQSAAPAQPPQFRKIDGMADVGFDDEQRSPSSPATGARLFGREAEQALLSAASSAVVDSAFNTLAQTVLVQNARTLEDLVREMLRPMLKSWLDDNLPGMVERLVRAEIERVARGR
jgi:cell pole-organizing protein PopZ